MKITVFTPAYNRGYIIGRLYESLCRQTYKDFEWLVVDDGSTDNTGALIEEFISESKILIRYIRQENGGKHRAINRGVREAHGDLFFIVDSDDYLTDNALERIIFHFGSVCDSPDFCGVSGVRATQKGGEKIGGEENWSVLDATFADARWGRFAIKGDLAEVYKSEVLREFPFPEIPGEKFCPEMLVWYQISRYYKLRFFYEKIYLCEYREDGLSAKIKTLCLKNPRGTALSHLSKYRNRLKLSQKIKAAIQFWRYSAVAGESFWSAARKIGWGGILLAPLGGLLALSGCRKNRK